MLARVAVVLVTALGFCYARHTLATTFQVYDDEGYTMLVIDRYLKGDHLYTGFFGQYGPFYYFAQSGMFRLLHMPVTHDAGRLITLLLWLVSAAFGGACVWRLSKSALLASAAGLAAVPLERVLANEPGHPQQVILPLLMLGAYLSTLPVRRRLSLFLMGAIGALLFFTKINVGVFYLLALAHVLICELPAGRSRQMGVALTTLSAAVLPALLMGRNMFHWGREYGPLAIVSALAVFFLASRARPGAVEPLRDLFYAAAGAVAMAVLIPLEVLREGTPLSALLDGVLWTPLKQSQIFSLPLMVAKVNVLLAALVFAVVWRYRDARWLNWVRLAAGLATLLLLADIRPLSGWILPLLPLTLTGAGGFARKFVTCLAVTQFLQTYPVAGSQVAISAAPMLVWAFLCIYDGAAGLVPRPMVRDYAFGGGIAFVLSVAMVASGNCSLTYPDPASRLPGAASMHLPPHLENLYVSLAGQIRNRCDVLFTEPGMGSLNFWSGVPAPNGWNLTGWVRSFGPREQQGILDILKSQPRACVVYRADGDAFWGVTATDVAASPLASYIAKMPTAFAQDRYELRVRGEPPGGD